MDASIKNIVTQLEELYSKFNEKFFRNELQKPVITLSPDSRKNCYGWCTTWKAWEKEENNSGTNGFYEINICSDYLTRPLEKVAGTLLHEMVHLYNLQLGINDCSRSGTYHNKKYKVSAEEHGLIVEKTDKYGWNKTSLNEDAKAFLDSLQVKKFELHRTEKKGFAKKTNVRKYVCPVCGMIIRATKEVHVICADCQVELEEEF